MLVIGLNQGTTYASIHGHSENANDIEDDTINVGLALFFFISIVASVAALCYYRGWKWNKGRKLERELTQQEEQRKEELINKATDNEVFTEKGPSNE